MLYIFLTVYIYKEYIIFRLYPTTLSGRYHVQITSANYHMIFTTFFISEWKLWGKGSVQSTVKTHFILVKCFLVSLSPCKLKKQFLNPHITSYSIFHIKLSITPAYYSKDFVFPYFLIIIVHTHICQIEYGLKKSIFRIMSSS